MSITANLALKKLEGYFVEPVSPEEYYSIFDIFKLKNLLTSIVDAGVLRLRIFLM